MKIFVAGRQEGKSTVAVEWLLQDERRVLITNDMRSKQHLLGIVQRLRYKERPSILLTYYTQRIATIGMVRDHEAFRGLDISEVGVDDADVILPRLLGIAQNISFATVTGEVAT
jgi:hypothetical protein